MSGTIQVSPELVTAGVGMENTMKIYHIDQDRSIPKLDHDTKTISIVSWSTGRNIDITGFWILEGLDQDTLAIDLGDAHAHRAHQVVYNRNSNCIESGYAAIGGYYNPTTGWYAGITKAKARVTFDSQEEMLAFHAEFYHKEQVEESVAA